MYARLDGKMSSNERMRAIEAFRKQPDICVFLVGPPNLSDRQECLPLKLTAKGRWSACNIRSVSTLSVCRAQCTQSLMQCKAL